MTIWRASCSLSRASDVIEITCYCKVDLVGLKASKTARAQQCSTSKTLRTQRSIVLMIHTKTLVKLRILWQMRFFLDVALWFPTTPIIMGVTPTGYAWDMSHAISVSVPYVPRTFSAVTAVQCEVTYCKLSLLSKPERRSKGQQILQRSFQTTGEFCSCRQAK